MADVTGDTLPDIVLSQALGAGTVEVFHNQLLGNGNNLLTRVLKFNPFPDLKEYIGGASIAAGDFDGAVDANGDKHDRNCGRHRRRRERPLADFQRAGARLR